MTKEEALKILTDWLEERFKNMPSGALPIKDEVVMIIGENGFEHWTFKGLIKIAYEL